MQAQHSTPRACIAPRLLRLSFSHASTTCTPACCSEADCTMCKPDRRHPCQGGQVEFCSVYKVNERLSAVCSGALCVVLEEQQQDGTWRLVSADDPVSNAVVTWCLLNNDMYPSIDQWFTSHQQHLSPQELKKAQGTACLSKKPSKARAPDNMDLFGPTHRFHRDSTTGAYQLTVKLEAGKVCLKDWWVRSSLYHAYNSHTFPLRLLLWIDPQQQQQQQVATSLQGATIHGCVSGAFKLVVATNDEPEVVRLATSDRLSCLKHVGKGRLEPLQELCKAAARRPEVGQFADLHKEKPKELEDMFGRAMADTQANSQKQQDALQRGKQELAISLQHASTARPLPVDHSDQQPREWALPQHHKLTKWPYNLKTLCFRVSRQHGGPDLAFGPVQDGIKKGKTGWDRLQAMGEQAAAHEQGLAVSQADIDSLCAMAHADYCTSGHINWRVVSDAPPPRRRRAAKPIQPPATPVGRQAEALGLLSSISWSMQGAASIAGNSHGAAAAFAPAPWLPPLEAAHAALALVAAAVAAPAGAPPAAAAAAAAGFGAPGPAGPCLPAVSQLADAKQPAGGALAAAPTLAVPELNLGLSQGVGGSRVARVQGPMGTLGLLTSPGAWASHARNDVRLAPAPALCSGYPQMGMLDASNYLVPTGLIARHCSVQAAGRASQQIGGCPPAAATSSATASSIFSSSPFSARPVVTSGFSPARTVDTPAPGKATNQVHASSSAEARMPDLRLVETAVTQAPARNADARVIAAGVSSCQGGAIELGGGLLLGQSLGSSAAQMDAAGTYPPVSAGAGALLEAVPTMAMDFSVGLGHEVQQGRGQKRSTSRRHETALEELEAQACACEDALQCWPSNAQLSRFLATGATCVLPEQVTTPAAKRHRPLGAAASTSSATSNGKPGMDVAFDDQLPSSPPDSAMPDDLLAADLFADLLGDDLLVTTSSAGATSPASGIWPAAEGAANPKDAFASAPGGLLAQQSEPQVFTPEVEELGTCTRHPLFLRSISMPGYSNGDSAGHWQLGIEKLVPAVGSMSGGLGSAAGLAPPEGDLHCHSDGMDDEVMTCWKVYDSFRCT